MISAVMPSRRFWPRTPGSPATRGTPRTPGRSAPARSGLAVLLVLAVGLLVGACGAATPSVVRPSNAPASAIPDTTPVQHGASALESELPDSIGGTTLTHASYDGPTFLATGTDANRAALTAMLGQLGREIGDLSLALATDPAGNLHFVEGIFRVAGTPGSALAPAWLAAQESATGNRLVQGTATIANQAVTKLSDPQLPSGGTTYVVVRPDSIVLILADDEQLVAEAIGKLH